MVRKAGKAAPTKKRKEVSESEKITNYIDVSTVQKKIYKRKDLDSEEQRQLLSVTDEDPLAMFDVDDSLADDESGESDRLNQQQYGMFEEDPSYYETLAQTQSQQVKVVPEMMDEEEAVKAQDGNGSKSTRGPASTVVTMKPTVAVQKGPVRTQPLQVPIASIRGSGLSVSDKYSKVLHAMSQTITAEAKEQITQWKPLLDRTLHYRFKALSAKNTSAYYQKCLLLALEFAALNRENSLSPAPFGQSEQFDRVTRILRNAKDRGSMHNSILMLCGPQGSGKSLIARSALAYLSLTQSSPTPSYIPLYLSGNQTLDDETMCLHLLQQVSASVGMTTAHTSSSIFVDVLTSLKELLVSMQHACDPKPVFVQEIDSFDILAEQSTKLNAGTIMVSRQSLLYALFELTANPDVNQVIQCHTRVPNATLGMEKRIRSRSQVDTVQFPYSITTDECNEYLQYLLTIPTQPSAERMQQVLDRYKENPAMQQVLQRNIDMLPSVARVQQYNDSLNSSLMCADIQKHVLASMSARGTNTGYLFQFARLLLYVSTNISVSYKLGELFSFLLQPHTWYAAVGQYQRQPNFAEPCIAQAHRTTPLEGVKMCLPLGKHNEQALQPQEVSISEATIAEVCETELEMVIIASICSLFTQEVTPCTFCRLYEEYDQYAKKASLSTVFSRALCIKAFRQLLHNNILTLCGKKRTMQVLQESLGSSGGSTFVTEGGVQSRKEASAFLDIYEAVALDEGENKDILTEFVRTTVQEQVCYRLLTKDDNKNVPVWIRDWLYTAKSAKN